MKWGADERTEILAVPTLQQQINSPKLTFSSDCLHGFLFLSHIVASFQLFNIRLWRSSQPCRSLGNRTMTCPLTRQVCAGPTHYHDKDEWSISNPLITAGSWLNVWYSSRIRVWVMIHEWLGGCDYMWFFWLFTEDFRMPLSLRPLVGDRLQYPLVV